jgi:hypothetical protein
MNCNERQSTIDVDRCESQFDVQPVPLIVSVTRLRSFGSRQNLIGKSRSSSAPTSPIPAQQTVSSYALFGCGKALTRMRTRRVRLLLVAIRMRHDQVPDSGLSTAREGFGDDRAVTLGMVACVIHAMSVHGFRACRSSVSRHAGLRFHAMSVQHFTACRSSS